MRRGRVVPSADEMEQRLKAEGKSHDEISKAMTQREDNRARVQAKYAKGHKTNAFGKA